MASRLYLTVDTSTPQVLAAVLRWDPDAPASGAAVAGQAVTEGATRHGEALSPNIALSLAEAGVGAAQLHAVVVGLGPGPFTGLRVGVVTAAAIADALGIQAYGVCSLDGFQAGPGRVLVATDARRKEIYWATYRDGDRVTGPEVNTPAAVAELLASEQFDRVLLGGAQRYTEQLVGLGPAQTGWPTGPGLLAAAARADVFGAEPAPLTPLYLRRPDATVPVPSKRSASQPTTDQLRGTRR